MKSVLIKIGGLPPGLYEHAKWQGPTKEWPWLISLVCITFLAWCTAYNCWKRDAWKTPVVYSGDAFDGMAMAKAYGCGEVKPILLKFPKSLGAPFVANWNDYPVIEQGIFAWYGLIVRLFGLFRGSNITLLSAHLLSAASFFLVCRFFGYDKLLSLAVAIVFSMSHFAFARNLSHLVLTFYWHVPLGILTTWWCARPNDFPLGFKRAAFSVAVAIAHGVQSIYYSGIFVQFLLLASVICVFRREPWRKIVFPLFLALIVVLVSALMVCNVFYYQLTHGPNLEAAFRNYAGVEIYGLKPIELILPFPHRIAALERWTSRAYLIKAHFLGEPGSAYLGVVGIFALGLLLWYSVRGFVHMDAKAIPVELWLVLWILLYSVVGGINGFIGLWGFVFFRGTNRYSIVILAVLLLFLVRQLSFLTRRWPRVAVAALALFISALGFFDQSFPIFLRRDVAHTRRQLRADAQVVATLEKGLPRAAMIFELPVADYPENPPIANMGDYEHFRPYLHSRFLRYSYGSDRGRPRERWQKEAVQLGASGLVSRLEEYGFSAILINKKGVADRAAGLLNDLRNAGRSTILIQSTDFVCVALNPVEHPSMPPSLESH